MEKVFATAESVCELRHQSTTSEYNYEPKMKENKPKMKESRKP